MNFKNAQSAFEYYYKKILKNGHILDNTKTIYNCSFVINNPLDNIIKTPWRKFNVEYAKYEWDWYLSGNRNADEISKRAKIWKNMQDKDGNVNSNYGYQWSRNNQIDYVVNELSKNQNSRRAVITIYDAKEHDLYEKDTPCTLNIIFYIEHNKLQMSVLMRSNDLVFGFCNDQFCFSNLQMLIAEKLNIKVGKYYHYATNMHIYERHWNMIS